MKSKKLTIKLLDTSDICSICGGSIKKEKQLLKKYYELTEGKEITESRLKARRLINLNLDHVKPKSLGGRNNINNLKLSHRTCNLKKAHNYYFK